MSLLYAYLNHQCHYPHISIIIYRQLRARGALSMFKDVPLRTRRALSLYKVYGDSALLVLNGTSLNGDSALLALNWLCLFSFIFFFLLPLMFNFTSSYSFCWLLLFIFYLFLLYLPIQISFLLFPRLRSWLSGSDLKLSTMWRPFRIPCRGNCALIIYRQGELYSA